MTQSGHHLLWASRKPNSTIINPVNCRAVGVSPSASHPISNTNGGTSEGDTAARPAPNTAEISAPASKGPTLTKNQQTMFSLLHGAGPGGLTTEQWNDQARAVDIGTKRKADLYDIRAALKSKGMVRQYVDRWITC